MGRKAHPLAARIKKMMQTDEDVGKISQATPVMIGGLRQHTGSSSGGGAASMPQQAPSRSSSHEANPCPVSARSACDGAVLAAAVQQVGGGRRAAQGQDADDEPPVRTLADACGGKQHRQLQLA